jgi:hypothetical protein
MIEHRRYEAHATLRSGECERRIDGSGLQLVRVILTDGGIVVAPDGTEHRRPDVICHLRPSEARELAERLLALADQADLERTAR